MRPWMIGVSPAQSPGQALIIEDTDFVVPRFQNLCVVCIGRGGAGGSGGQNAAGGGGGGGALSYSNAVPVAAGETLSIIIDDASTRIQRADGSIVCRAQAGASASGINPGLGGSRTAGVGDARFSGGNGYQGTGSTAFQGGAGGGAAGYSGGGGDAFTSGAGGGGAGGGSLGTSINVDGKSGGGVGPIKEGPSGVSVIFQHGTGGSGGADGSDAAGGNYGGAGGGGKRYEGG